MKRSRVLEAVDDEAGLPYEKTRLARKAVPARRRLSALLALFAVALVIEAAVDRSFGWLLGAAAVAGFAWGVRQDRLGALMGAGLVVVLAVLLPIRWFFVGLDVPGLITAAVAFVFGVASLPDLVLLIRDAELQYAYGRWARRDA